MSPGTGVLSLHYVLLGRYRKPAVPIKAMRCNARMALIVLETESPPFNLRNWTDTMPLSEEGFIARVSIRHSVSSDAVRTILRALRSDGGTMAQFSHPGGMSQWSPGMTMVGDMFNHSLKSKLDAVCTELAAYVPMSLKCLRLIGDVAATILRSAIVQRGSVQIGGPLISEHPALLAHKMNFGTRFFQEDW